MGQLQLRWQEDVEKLFPNPGPLPNFSCCLPEPGVFKHGRLP